VSAQSSGSADRPLRVTERDRRHVAWIKQRLLSDWGKSALATNAEAAMRRILETEVRQLFDAATLSAFIDKVSGDPILSDTIRPLFRASMLLSMARLREDPDKLGVYVSDEAKELIEQLLSQPNLLPEKFVKRLLSHGAFEEISRDVLDHALREFAEKIDPFKAEWGLPSLLKLKGPFSLGISAVAKSIEAVRQEFDKRVEPERKRFLAVFARKSLEMVADFMIKRSDQPEFMALRRELFAWLLEQPATEKTTELTERAGHAIARHVSQLEATKRRRRAQIDLVLTAHAAQTLAQALSVYGARVTVDAKPFVDAAWPLVKVALDTPEAESFFLELVSSFPEAPLRGDSFDDPGSGGGSP
jgi:hypothetical protein